MVDLNKVKEMLKEENYAYEHRWEIFGLLFDALKEGQAEAANMLGWVYNNDVLCESSLNTMVAYWNLSKNMSDPEGLYVWATDSHFTDSIYALTLLKKSADLEYLDAKYEYAYRIQKVDAYQSDKMMKDAADNGHIKACFQYAMRMRKIAISEDDYKESFKYMKMAAEKDYPEAIYLLAKMYDFGIGTKINYVEARFWYEKCHNYLYSNAASGYVGRHYLYGLGGLEINAKKAAELFEIAVKQTSRCPSEILYEYARCYELGLGVDVDFEKANDLRKQAIINSQTIR